MNLQLETEPLHQAAGFIGSQHARLSVITTWNIEDAGAVVTISSQLIFK